MTSSRKLQLHFLNRWSETRISDESQTVCTWWLQLWKSGMLPLWLYTNDSPFLLSQTMVAAFLSKSSLPSPSFSSFLSSLSLMFFHLPPSPPFSPPLLFSPGNNVREQKTLWFAYEIIILIDRELTVFLCERSQRRNCTIFPQQFYCCVGLAAP